MNKLVDNLIVGIMWLLIAPATVLMAPACLLAMWAGKRDDKRRFK